MTDTSKLPLPPKFPDLRERMRPHIVTYRPRTPWRDVAAIAACTVAIVMLAAGVFAAWAALNYTCQPVDQIGALLRGMSYDR